MSTVLRPVGPRPARVYWIRRLVLLAVAVLLGALAWGQLRPSGAAGEEPTDPAGGTAQTPAEDAATVTDDGGADDAVTGPAACDPALLAITLTSDATTYPEGAAAQLAVGITNTGDVSCTLDAGEAAREVLITSGADRIWSSRDCPVEPAERLVLLESGARVDSTVTWSRVRSAEGCPADLPAPRAGTYTAVASLLGASSAALVFDLT